MQDFMLKLCVLPSLCLSMLPTRPQKLIVPCARLNTDSLRLQRWCSQYLSHHGLSRNPLPALWQLFLSVDSLALLLSMSSRPRPPCFAQGPDTSYTETVDDSEVLFVPCFLLFGKVCLAPGPPHGGSRGPPPGGVRPPFGEAGRRRRNWGRYSPSSMAPAHAKLYYVQGASKGRIGRFR